MPIGRVAGQPGDLQPHDDASLTQGDLADQLLEAIARRRAGAGFAEVVVDHMNPLGGPTRCYRAIAQRILALRALDVLGDLPQG